jgi:hypothetical protein
VWAISGVIAVWWAWRWRAGPSQWRRSSRFPLLCGLWSPPAP